MSDVQQRMHELMEMIDRSIQMADDRRELLMLGCAMLQRTREIFDQEIGEEGRRTMFKDMI
jgi:hypothetical protein